MASKQQQWHEDGKCLIDDIYAKLKEVEDSLSKLREIRRKTIQELEKLIAKAKAEEEARKHGRNTKIANISGSSVAIVGVILGVVGFGLSFVTFGASLGLTVAGAALGGAGGLTVAGTTLTKYFLDKDIFKEVQAAVAKDREATREFLTAYTGIKSRVQGVDKLGLVKELLVEILNSPFFSSCKGRKSSGPAAHIGGFVASAAVVLFLNIQTLVTETKSLHKGTDEVEESIKNVISMLKLPEDGEITKIIEECLRECVSDKLYDNVMSQLSGQS